MDNHQQPSQRQSHAGRPPACAEHTRRSGEADLGTVVDKCCISVQPSWILNLQGTSPMTIATQACELQPTSHTCHQHPHTPKFVLCVHTMCTVDQTCSGVSYGTWRTHLLRGVQALRRAHCTRCCVASSLAMPIPQTDTNSPSVTASSPVRL